jgi:peptide/nickel transport system substrate-binding protein
MNRKILAIVFMLSITLMLVITPMASGAGIPNPDTITYYTISGPDSDWGTDPAGAYDTASETMLQQTYEPLFMYANTSLVTFVPMLADWWNGYTGDGRTAGGIMVPLDPSIPSNLTYLNSVGIYPPAWAEETWLFHIREDMPWQNPVYGNVEVHDLVYSIQRGMLQDAVSGVQWMMYGPLLGVGTASYWFNQTGDGTWHYNDTEGLGYYVKTAIEGNDATGYVAFNLIAPYAPFMQILTQSWAFVLNKQWCIERGCIDTDIALSNNPGNYTEFIDPTHYQPSISPLMESGVVDSPWPMMGTGPYRMIKYDTDPHTGQQYYQKFVDYWGGWPARGSQGFSEYVRIKIVEEWAIRKALFLSTGSTQIDLTDVPMANCAELHTAGKDSPVLPGLRLTKYLRQMTGSLFFNYKVGVGSAFMPQLGSVDKPDLFSDRDLRLAFMYCFNGSQFLKQYFLGEATQPTTVMPAGTAYYNASKEVRAINLSKATQLFQRAWGGQVWSQGITVKLVYNTGNVAGQTVMSMLADTIMNSIVWPIGVTVDVKATAVPWSTYLPEMKYRQLPVFVVERMADYPDPDDWFGPFMDPYGTYSGISQAIEYGLDPSTMNWSSTASYGPPPYANVLGETVSEINNTYIHHIILAALNQPPVIREKLYNEMMDIYFAESAGEALYQPINRHYERDWVQGWVGGYSNNPIAPGPYFYQMWKAALQPIIGVDLVAVSIQNTTYVPPITVDNLTGNMLDWKTLAVVHVNYTLRVKYNNVTGPVIYANVMLKRTDIWTGNYYFPIILTIFLMPDEDYSVNVQWHENTTMTNGIWKISLVTEPLGIAGGTVVDSNPSNNQVDSPYMIKSIHDNKTYVVGDLGGGTPEQFGKFDGRCDAKDLALFMKCYKGMAPPEFMYLADLGGGLDARHIKIQSDGIFDGKDIMLFTLIIRGLDRLVVGDLGSGNSTKPPVPEFFWVDGLVRGGDLQLFLTCYHNNVTSEWPSEAMELADLGGGVPPTFFQYDGEVDGKDLCLFLRCYHGERHVFPDP